VPADSPRDFWHESTLAYSEEPGFIERQYGLPSMASLAEPYETQGVARFIELPSFRPERIYTFIYRRGGLEVSSVVGATSLWSSLPFYAPGREPQPERPRAPFMLRTPTVVQRQSNSQFEVHASWHGGPCYGVR
jgi:hypothetical protein